MRLEENGLFYAEGENVFSFNEDFTNGIQLKSNIIFKGDKFLEYQKDLIQDFVANILDLLKEENYNVDDIKGNFEIGLQNLNTKFKLFSDKVRDVEYFEIKGFVQIVVDGVLITSMIGDTTLMIFRNNKLYYSLHNSPTKGKIDLFSDFVEGDIESADEILYIGIKVSDILDDNDIKEIESTVKHDNNETPLFSFIAEALKSRVGEESIGFIKQYNVNTMSSRFSNRGNNRRTRDNNISGGGHWKMKMLANKYYVTIVLGGLVILFMLYHVLSELLNKTESDVFVTSSGIEVDVTIEDIKKDIYMFRSMPPDSDEKGIKYHEISQKLDMLEKKGRWLEDISQLKKVLQTNYYEGFNIVYLTSLGQLDDPVSNKTTKVLTFNSAEKEKLGDFVNISRGKNLMIAGMKGALVGAINDGIRGNIVDYGTDETVKGCGKNILGDGIYCFTQGGKIMNITKGGIESVTTTSQGGFPSTIAGISVYSKSSMYIFQPNLDSLGKQVLLTRYRNVLGSETQFQEGQNYSVVGIQTGMDIGTGFNAFAIDSTFLVRSRGSLFQFWRGENASLNLEIRKVPIMGGDKFTSTYGQNIKIISYTNSRFVYIFDKDNQTFTVYESRPQKNNETFSKSYNLYYLFRFKFDLEKMKVMDVIIPEETGDKPEVYILSDDGVNKVNLYEFIDSIKENNTLKKVSE